MFKDLLGFAGFHRKHSIAGHFFTGIRDANE